MPNDNHKFILALKQIRGIGDKIAQKIIKNFEVPEQIFSSGKDELSKIGGIGENICQEIIKFRNWEEIEKQIEKCRKSGFKIISILDDCYPENLINIYNPPTVIYCRGEILNRDKNSVAVVGSRLGNSYGKLITNKIVEGLVDHGITIVSGMARGIDTFAHQNAIKTGGRTIAVLGSGLSQVYPPENINLYKKISENGAIISEFPVGTKPEAANFPKRNRIISGLSKGVLIIQASNKSGSLITADFALQQNREVFATPGNIGSKLSEGTNNLIKNGAKLVQSAEDIINEMCLENINIKNIPEIQIDIQNNNLSRNEIEILGLLENKPMCLDELMDMSSIRAPEIINLLLKMEIAGLIENLPGNLYQVL